MFGSWFKPRCPVSTRDKVWTETRLRWLVDQLGSDALRRAQVVLPTAEFFPEAWGGSDRELTALFEQICQWMGISSDAVGLEIVSDRQLVDAVGHYDYTPETLQQYGRPIIRIVDSLLQMPLQLASTLAHELAHERLLGGELISESVADHEFVTDLLPLSLGLGIIQANATIQDGTIREGHLTWYQSTRIGYLSSLQLGYALALFAWHRQERSPEWARYLRLDARSVFNKGLKFLAAGGESLFGLDYARQSVAPGTPQEWVARLRSPRADMRLATIWQVDEQTPVCPELAAALARCLEDRDPSIPGDAARALHCLGENADEVVPHLVPLLSSSHEDTVCGALEVLGARQALPDRVLPQVGHLLSDDRMGVVNAAITAAQQYGQAAECILQPLVQALIRSVTKCNSLAEPLSLAVATACDNPRAAVAKWMPDHADDELREVVDNLLLDAERTAKLGGQQ